MSEVKYRAVKTLYIPYVNMDGKNVSIERMCRAADVGASAAVSDLERVYGEKNGILGSVVLTDVPEKKAVMMTVIVDFL